MRRWVRTVVFAGSVALAAGVELGGGALSAGAQPQAQGAPEEQRATSFQAMTGPAKESIAGGPLLLAAYGAVWLVLAGLVWRIGARAMQTRERLARLEAAAQKRGAGGAAGAHADH